MKLFSNFDTKLKYKEYRKMQKKFGTDQISLLSKSSLFRFLFVDLPFFAWAFVCLLLLYLFFSWFDRAGVLFGALPITIITAFFVWPKIIKHFIDYNMDFSIVTPTILYRYDQEGIINRHIITIHTNSIKSISIKKGGLLYSMFDNGDIIFFTEGDEDQGEVILTYMKDPEAIRSKVGSIIEHTL